MLFKYPKNAEFNRVLPKNKIYANAKISAALKKKFIDGIDKIIWQYKLSSETINLPPKKDVPEIEVFRIELRQAEIREDVLRCIDNAIPFPIIYELVFEDRVKSKAAFKRPSDADAGKWVTEIYFESDWQNVETPRTELPLAIDLGTLYEKILGSLMPPNAPSLGDIRGQVLHITELRRLETEAEKLVSRIGREKQFNRKVELNVELRKIQKKLLHHRVTENTEKF